MDYDSGGCENDGAHVLLECYLIFDIYRYALPWDFWETFGGIQDIIHLYASKLEDVNPVILKFGHNHKNGMVFFIPTLPFWLVSQKVSAFIDD